MKKEKSSHTAIAMLSLFSFFFLPFMASHLLAFASPPSPSNLPPLPPLVLVPGTAGNQLQIRLTPQYKPPFFLCRPCCWNRNYFRIWLDLPGLFPPFTRCFADRLRLVYNHSTGLCENAPGVESRVPYFGSTEGLAYLDPLFRKLSVYMGVLVQALDAKGYVDGKSLFGAPYDFRYAPGKYAAPVAASYLEDLKNLIEKAYYLNDNQKVVLLSHSLGGLWVLYFLNHQPLSWRQQYVKHFVSISAPWGGSVQLIRTYASGYTEGIPFINPLVLREEQRTSESNFWLLPVPSVFGNFTMVVTPTKNYSAFDIPEIMEDVGYPEGAPLYLSRVPQLTENLEVPGVPVTLIYSHGIETPEKLIYGENGFDEQPMIVYGDGDGTVNLRSLSAVVEKWNMTAEQMVKVIEIPGKTHTKILTDESSVEVIVSEILGENTQTQPLFVN